MIDLHTHVLPGVDDGARQLAESIEMARIASADGVRTLVATPHIREDFDVRIDELGGRVAELNAELERTQVPVQVVVGGEVGMTKCAALSDGELRSVSLGGRSRYLLIECPYGTVPESFDQTIFDLAIRGFVALIAHPERSPTFAADPERLAMLARRGALVQVTASSLTGGFGRDTASFALELVRRRIAHSIASDSHGPGNRPPELSPACELLKSKSPDSSEYVNWMTSELPRRILADEPIEPPTLLAGSGRKRSPRGLLARVRRSGGRGGQ